MAKIYTIGYQGLNLKSFLDALIAARIDVVLDIREVAWSYKRGFSKTPLKQALYDAKIQYAHLKTAGNPKDNRRSSKTVQECLENYARWLEEHPMGHEHLLEFIMAADAYNLRVCLICYERNPHHCHRSVLLGIVSQKLPSLAITHLMASSKEVKVGTKLGIP